MTTQKRGLGRGLEALLVDVAKPVKAKESVPTPHATLADDHAAIATIALMKAIQKENANLIKEVEVLKDLLDDFEALVQNLNIDKPTL
ncbi:MAG: hypothetical protein Q8Q54_14805 [Methylococcales bacterium]|nr:hypothetical protein [Methylococcales bacterium]MDP3840186.1 hypothetical protein [Methylococcales bacterium]